MTDAEDYGLEEEPLVELTAPDGTVLHFRYGATVPYAGKEYVVLLEMENTPEGEEQILVTSVEDDGQGGMTFVVAEEEDVIQTVFDKYTALKVEAGLDGLSDAE